MLLLFFRSLDQAFRGPLGKTRSQLQVCVGSPSLCLSTHSFGSLFICFIFKDMLWIALEAGKLVVVFAFILVLGVIHLV